MKTLLDLWRRLIGERISRGGAAEPGRATGPATIVMLGVGEANGGEDEATRAAREWAQGAAGRARVLWWNDQAGGKGPEAWLKDAGAVRVDLLCAGAGGGLGAWRKDGGEGGVAGGAALFFRNRVEAVAFVTNAATLELLRYHQFHILRADGADVRMVAGDAPPRDGELLLALHPRFMRQTLQGAARGAAPDMPGFFKQYSIEPRGVIHIGGGDGGVGAGGGVGGGELEMYARMGFKRILFIEANAAIHQRVLAQIQARGGGGGAGAGGGAPAMQAILCAVGSGNGMRMMHGTSDIRYNSLLQPGKILELVPDLRETGQTLVSVRRVDHVLREIGQNAADYNLLHVAARGAEREVLEGCEELLSSLDAISSEVYYDELYRNGALVEEVDEWLTERRFERLFTGTVVSPAWGTAFYLKNPAVSMRNLGRWGRFGNQVFEYAFIKIAGRTHGLSVETGAWVGNQLFAANDPIARRQFPQHMETTYALKDSQVARIGFRPVNIDLCGVFQYHSSYYAPHRDYFRELLEPAPALKKSLDEGISRIMRAEDAKTLVVLHLRRGDYGYGMFFLPPNKWYQDWLRELWPRLDAPALYIATDEPGKVVGDFAEYRPKIAADLRAPAFGADYYADYYVMTQADAIAISNSSFSFSACMLNRRAGLAGSEGGMVAGAKAFMRPDLFAGRLVPFAPWDAEPLLHRELGMVDDKMLEKGVAEYLKRPGDQQLLTAMRNMRAQVADSWAQIKGGQLAIVAGMDLWRSYALLRRAGLRQLPLVEGEMALVTVIEGRLKGAISSAGGLDAVGPYIAATLYLEPSRLPAVDLGVLPEAGRELLRS